MLWYSPALFIAICSAGFGDQWWDSMPFTDSEISLSVGKFKGKKIDFWEKKIEIFRGIRYATADRFENPQAILQNSDVNVKDAQQKAPSCFQVLEGPELAGKEEQMANEGKMVEDCLTLDIYRPEGAENAGVLLWIHGGSFVSGSSQEYDGIAQASRGNIVVIVQYRLALFGFLNMFDASNGKPIGGNYGLLDQQMAIRFTFENAENMGANPNKITINGESAGAMSVALHLHNENSARYISGAIAQSGATLNAFILEELQMSSAVNKVWHEICSAVPSCFSSSPYGNTAEEAENYLNSLRNTSASEIWIAAMEKCTSCLLPGFFGPVPNDGVFFSGDPRNNIRNRNLRTTIPYFISTTSFEGTLLFEDHFRLIGGINQMDLLLPGSTSKINSYLTVYNNAAGVNAQRDTLSYEQEFALARFIYGDLLLREPSYEEALAYSEAGAAVYAFYFDTDSTLDLMNPGEPSCCGVGHATDLLYTFGVDLGSATESWERSLINYIGNHFESIIKDGVPSNDWPMFKQDSQNHLALRNSETESAAFVERIQIPLPSKKAIEHWRNLSSSASLNVISFFIACYFLAV